MRRQATGVVIVLLSWLWMSGIAQAGEIYVVRAGDTLWRVSHRFGVRPADLAAANHLILTGTIHPGLRLALPEAGSADAQAGVRVSSSPRSSAFSSSVVRVAMEFLGRPYRWSGTGFGGFDCSGFIARIFAAVGRQVPHSSFAQYEAGVRVPQWALAPGDLVFFHTYGPGASHVGLYIGGSRFIHASFSRGVSIASFEEPYYRDRYIGARRL